MTTAQRRHVAAVASEMKRYAAQLAYPPGDQRSNRDGFSWGLSETQAFDFLARGGIMQFDCSEYTPWLHKCAGSWRWSSPGYTGSHLQTWRATGWTTYTNGAEADVGAIVVYFDAEFPVTGAHEATVVVPSSRDGDPIVSSHGRPGLDVVRHKELMAAAGFTRAEFLSVTRL